METLTYIKPDMIIRLEHTRTRTYLHSHDVRPPVSNVDFQNEVSGFEGDANDNWVWNWMNLVSCFLSIQGFSSIFVFFFGRSRMNER
jgi:dolichyl-phosphate-mannose--protein O-mannosyl transferase